MAKNKKKKAKPAKKATVWGKIWGGIKFVVTTISNDRCVERRKVKWYWAVLFAVCSCVLALAPVMSTYFGRSGSSFLSSPNYGYETGLAYFTEELGTKSDATPFLINDSGELVIDGKDADNNETAFKDALGTTVDSETTLTYYAHVYEKTEIVYKDPNASSEDASSDASSSAVILEPTYVTTKVIDFVVYYCPDDEAVSSFASTILKGEDPNKSLFGASVSVYSTNFMIFGRTQFYACKKPNGTSSPASSIICGYENADLYGKSLANLAQNDLYGNKYEYVTDAEYRASLITGWGQVFTAGWDQNRIMTGWQFTGIAAAINVSITFFAGLMIFLMTRGKNNPFRTYTFWDGQKIAYLASAAPALLSLLGFIPGLSSFAMFIYMFLLGIRIFWMSLKTLRPYQPQ